MIFPVKITRVEIFGSALRNKPVPGDLDIAIRYLEDPSVKLLHDLLREIFEKMPRIEFETPKDAVLNYVENTYKNNFKRETLDFIKSVYSIWLDSFKWSSLIYPWIVPHPQTIVKKMLIKGTKEIHIEHFSKESEKHTSVATIFETIWDNNNRDIFTNISRIFSPDLLKKNVLKELENIDIQLRTHKKQIKIATKAFQILQQSEIDFSKKDDTRDWVKKQMCELFPKINSELVYKSLVISNFDNSNFNLKFNKKLFEVKSLDELQKIIERKRTVLKEAIQELFVIRTSLYYLIESREKEPSFWGRYLTIDSYVCVRVLQSVPKRDVSEKNIRKFLKKLNLQEDLVESTHFGRTRFDIKRTTE